MTCSGAMEIRAIRDDELTAYRTAMIGTFGGDAELDAAGDERLRAILEPGRAFGAFDGATLVATAGTYTFTMTVPGATCRVGGLTQVTVRPTHRRRGVLRGLIDAHLRDVRDRGEPIAALWASEATIYGRFGYGVATFADSVELTTAGLTIGDGLEVDAVELVDDATARRVLPEVYAAAIADRPGSYARTPGWWQHRWFVDRPDLRKGASPRRHVVARRDGAVTGYVIYRQRPDWDHGVATGALAIEELIARDARAEATLWRYACAVDLFPNVSYWNAPVDSLLPWLASDLRRLRRRRVDAMWVRPDDVARALAARRYADDGVLRLEVEDETIELEVASGAAQATPTTRRPDLTLDRAALGSIYLGGVAPSLLARAGRITGGAAALALADRLFAWPLAPWCAELF